MKINDDGKNIRDAVKELKITEAQANRLDELDGKDGSIGKSIFSIASSVKGGLVPFCADSKLIAEVKDVLEIQVPFADASRADYKEYKEVQKKQDFEKDIKKHIADRIKHLKRNRKVVADYAKVPCTKGKEFCALRDAAYDPKDDLWHNDRALPRTIEFYEFELDCLKKGLVFHVDYVPNELKEKYGEDFERLMEEYQNSVIETLPPEEP